MILNKVTLHNFMSYADAQLDLASIAVACLAGSNGAGKSAILDAVTWALWEQARAESDELISLGTQEMWVEVGFSLEGQEYRVKRSRQKAFSTRGTRAGSKGALELQVATEKGWRSLTGSNLRETQKQITQLLRMDHDTFVNSVYLRQGRADEFTSRLPSERKQILGDILGLNYFDCLQELARQKARDLKISLAQLEMKVEELPDLQAKASTLKEEYAQTEEKARQAGQKAAGYGQTLSALRSRLAEADFARRLLEDARARTLELESDIAFQFKRDEQLQDKLAELQELIARAAEIEQAAGQFAQLKQKVEILDQRALTWQELAGKRLEYQSALANLRSRLEVKLELTLAGLKDLEKKKQQLSKDPAEEEKLASAHKRFKEMLAREALLSVCQETFSQLTARADELYSIVAESRIRLEAEIEQKEKASEELTSLLESSGAIEEERQALEKQVSQLECLEVELELVESKGLQVKSCLEQKALQIKELKRRQHESALKIKKLEEHSHTAVCPLCSAAIVDRSAVIGQWQKEIDAMASEMAILAQDSGQLESERSHLRKQYQELKSKLDGRKALDKKIGQFNEKLAAIEKARVAGQRVADELTQLKSRLAGQDYAQIERESLVNVKAEIYKLEFDPVIYANLQAQIRQERYIETRYQQGKRDMGELSKLNEEIPKIKREAEEISAQLSKEAYGAEIRAELSVTEEKLEKLAYDRQNHQELSHKLTELISAGELYHQLETARAEAPAAGQALESCRQHLLDKQEQLARLKRDMAGWAEAFSERSQLEAEIKETEPLESRWAASHQALATEEAVLSARLTQIKQEMDKLTAQKQELEAARANLSDLQLLAEALGKKGIQAVIIENSVPEIESEANRILGRLSENQMHIALVTQQKNKSGNVVETLDLLIGDAVGTRNYELYSGGEAFKINFACRVALSRLLARRAGARLETLIIDEGFGSQDEQSRQRLVQVIGQIQNDFARILVITHVGELREMFPRHIYVSKTNGTSQIQIV